MTCDSYSEGQESLFYNFQYNLFNFYGERTRESRRDRWLNYYCPRIFAVLGVAYNSFSNEKEKKALTPTNDRFGETPQRGSRFNERNSTGRFANTKSKVKSLIPLHAGCLVGKQNENLFSTNRTRMNPLQSVKQEVKR